MNTRYPPGRPYEPHEPKRSEYVTYDFKSSKNIYYDINVGDSDFDLEQHFADRDEEMPALPAKRYWQNLSLQDIVDLAPPGAKLSDIILDISFPRYMDYVEVSFTHTVRDLELEEADYQRALKHYEEEHEKYRVAYAKYEAELADYNKWKTGQEIAELEGKLAALKK